MIRTSLASVLLASLALVGAARAADDKPYAPIPAEIGKAVTPTPDLLAFAAKVRAAAAAEDVEAVFSMIADEVTIVTTGISVNSDQRIAKYGPYENAERALSDIGSNFQEGDLLAGGRKIDIGAVHRKSTFEVIVSSIDAAEWGRDPLVKGGFCTYRGARWSAAAGEKAGEASGAGSTGGWFVEAPTKVFKSHAPGAPTVATLKPGFLYLQGYLKDAPEGWMGIILPTGGVGAVHQTSLKRARTWGLCFLPNVDGGWLVSAFATSLL